MLRPFGPLKLLCLGLCLVTAGGCYFFNKSKPNGNDNDGSSGVIGASLGPLAGGINAEALEGVYAAGTTHAPAGSRPDPDTFVRLLLRGYRTEGSMVARETGRVEQYRLLLGGASEDFAIAPQDSYDATSVLAELKVAEEVCLGLVAPQPQKHGDWTSILPRSPQDSAENIKFLAQRLLGLPSADLSAELLTSLNNILILAKGGGSLTRETYIPVCTALILDADALLL